MANRKENFVLGEYYHIYNRGNSKQSIFLDDQDRDRFVKLLYLCNSTKSFNFRNDIIDSKIDAFDFDREDEIVSIGAWVLMSNHFHLYLTLSPRLNLKDKENLISVFMSKLSTAYSMYFNKKYERIGSLFEGRFKSVHIKNDEHAKYNFSYIHLNPVKLIDPNWKERGLKSIKKTLEFLNKYKWSSYPDYKGVKRLENKIISPKDFPDYFSDKKVFEEEIFDWLNFIE
jgi:putative transposase